MFRVSRVQVFRVWGVQVFRCVRWGWGWGMGCGMKMVLDESGLG